MVLEGFTRSLEPLELLTVDQVQEIRKSTLSVLERTGVRFESDWALDFLKGNGCDVDFQNKRVRFPPGLVEECLRKCPSTFHLKARDTQNDLQLGGCTTYFSNAAAMNTIDLDTYMPRPATRQEFIEYVTVLDALEYFHYHNCSPYFGFKGIPSIMCLLEDLALRLTHSTKHTQYCSSNDSEIFHIRMLKAVGTQGTGALTASPPLTWYGDQVLQARRSIEAGFPLSTCEGCMMGGTGPATPVGSVVSSSAEQMAIIVLVQLLHPGHPIAVGHSSFPMNMSSGAPSFGQIDASTSNLLFNQVWRSYRLPIFNYTPGFSSSKRMDFQTGYEKGVAGVLAALSGAHMIFLYGCVSSEIAAHPLQAVLDDDVAGAIGRFIEGAETSDETLATDLINEVGPIPGHYLSTAHTRKWWKIVQFIPKVADRLTYPEWEKTGKKSCIDYAKLRLEEILKTHRPSKLLTENQEDALRQILEEAREYYEKKGVI